MGKNLKDQRGKRGYHDPRGGHSRTAKQSQYSPNAWSGKRGFAGAATCKIRGSENRRPSKVRHIPVEQYLAEKATQEK